MGICISSLLRENGNVDLVRLYTHGDQSTTQKRGRGGKEGGINEGERRPTHRSAGSRNNKLQPPGEGDAGHAVDYPPGAPLAKPPASRCVCLLVDDDAADAAATWCVDEAARRQDTQRNEEPLVSQRARRDIAFVRGHARIDLKSIRTSAATEESIDSRRHDGDLMRILEARF